MGMMPGIDRTKTSKWWISLIVIVVVGIVLFVDLQTPIGGNIKFYRTWLECGQQPYQEDDWAYSPTGSYKLSPAIGILREHNEPYYCTPHDAEMAGLSADIEKAEFPHLNSEERSHIKNRFNIP